MQGRSIRITQATSSRYLFSDFRVLHLQYFSLNVDPGASSFRLVGVNRKSKIIPHGHHISAWAIKWKPNWPSCWVGRLKLWVVGFNGWFLHGVRKRGSKAHTWQAAYYGSYTEADTDFLLSLDWGTIWEYPLLTGIITAISAGHECRCLNERSNWKPQAAAVFSAGN